MLKVKRLRTADCVVGGFRYASSEQLVGSLLLGLYDDRGLLHHVGFTSAIADKDKPAADRTPGETCRAARLHGRCAGRTQPLEHREIGRVAAAAARSWWSRFATIM